MTQFPFYIKMIFFSFLVLFKMEFEVEVKVKIIRDF